jgi:LAO/AO transport system kinase
MRPSPSPSTSALVELVRSGDRRAIARALSEVENHPDGPLSAALFPHSGRAHIVGLTGAPGSGKSTLVSALATVYRGRQRTVGIVAVDPSSPFTGGAVLGDRVRMGTHHRDEGVFIRSMASRGNVGGLAVATADAVRVLDVAGFDVVVVETVGAGQAEVEIADEAHTTVVVAVPGLGDDIQAIKAGILEIADIYCVNKADLPGADRTVAHLQQMLTLGMRGRDVEWMPPIVETVATTGAGTEALADAIDRHEGFLRAGDGWRERERARAVAELRRRLHARMVEGLLAQTGASRVDELLEGIVARRIDPAAAVDSLVAAAAAG